MNLAHVTASRSAREMRQLHDVAHALLAAVSRASWHDGVTRNIICASAVISAGSSINSVHVVYYQRLPRNNVHSQCATWRSVREIFGTTAARTSSFGMSMSAVRARSAS